MRRMLLLLSAAAVIACGQPTQTADAPEATAQSAPVAPAQLEETPRYVGLWGASQEMCADPPWTVHAGELSTKGEVHCAFNTVTPIANGYDIAATCTAEAPPAPYNIQFSFAENSDTLLISGGPWAAPNALVRCGPLPEAPAQ